MSPVDRVLAQLEAIGKPARETRRGYAACCPAHADEAHSLNIRESLFGRAALVCMDGCSLDEITTALGLSLADLEPVAKRWGSA